MNYLAIDTSNKIASVSIFENNNLLNEKFSDDQKTHSEKLLPIIDELLKEKYNEIEYNSEIKLKTNNMKKNNNLLLFHTESNTSATTTDAGRAQQIRPVAGKETWK